MTDTSAGGWYYVANGERIGPRTLDEVRASVASGELADDTLVWTTGMTDWVTVAEIPLLATSWKLHGSEPAAPQLQWPPEPSTYGRPPADDRFEARPWHRWLARIVDGFVMNSLLTLILTPLLVLVFGPPPVLTPEMMSDPATMLSPPMLRVWGTVLVISALMVPLEALLLSTRGTTPGKALLGIRVATVDGELPSYRVALSRSFRVWVLGSGLGLPPLSIITWIIGYILLMRSGEAPWDRALGLRVEHGGITPARGFAIGAVIVMIVLLTALSTAGIQAPR